MLLPSSSRRAMAAVHTPPSLTRGEIELAMQEEKRSHRPALIPVSPRHLAVEVATTIAAEAARSSLVASPLSSKESPPLFINIVQGRRKSRASISGGESLCCVTTAPCLAAVDLSIVHCRRSSCHCRLSTTKNSAA